MRSRAGLGAGSWAEPRSDAEERLKDMKVLVTQRREQLKSLNTEREGEGERGRGREGEGEREREGRERIPVEWLGIFFCLCAKGNRLGVKGRIESESVPEEKQKPTNILKESLEYAL